MGLRQEELQIYKLSMELGDMVWEIVKSWDYFARDTIGKQLVKSCDSISANISEGFGRFHYKENKNFNYISRGSLSETKTWIIKAYQRKLINDNDFKELIRRMDIISVKLNNYIKTIGKSFNDPSIHDNS
jgi:four helix bundle protein